MSIHLIGIIVLILIFVVGTLRPVNIGILALIATFAVGTLVAGEDVDALLAGFPPDLFVLLVGVTYLFGLAATNGTIEWIIDRVVGRLGDRPVLVPWVIFVAAAIPTMAGALGPAGVALLAPLCLRLGKRYGIDARMAAFMVCCGSSAGNFSPLNGLAVIAQGSASREGIELSSAGLFFGNLAYNIVLGVVVFLIFGGRRLFGVSSAQLLADREEENPAAQRASGPAAGSGDADDGFEAIGAAGGTALERKAPTKLRVDQIATIVVILAVATAALVFDFDIGFLALCGAALLHLVFPKTSKGADRRIVWTVVLLICGVVTYVGALQRFGTIDVIGDGIASLGSPLLIALLLCLVGAATSAFASSAALIGVLVPLAAPFLAAGDIGATALLTALAVSSTVVDTSPFSSVGALTIANADEADQARIYRSMLIWMAAMIITAPLVTFVVFVLPGS